MNVVIYARYSSDKQTEQSIEGQLRVCREFAERHGYHIINEYIDRAISGTSDNRPAFLEMIEASNEKGFEGVLVYKLDRFSRNKYHNVVYKHKLAQNGVKVISATEVISDTPEGVLVEGLLEMMAELYSKDLSQKVKRGMRESAIKGNFLGGTILYGYKVEDKKIMIDEEKAPAIRYLFEEYANGKSKKQIIDELNAMGYRTKSGKKFDYHSFQNTMSNKKYIGVFDNGEIQNDGYYPAIIEREVFDKVQLKLKEHKQTTATQKAKVEYLLTGKAFCGHCGATMIGVSGTSKTGLTHHYYQCSNSKKYHSCHKKNEKKDYIEQYVVEQTLKFVLTPKRIDAIAAGVLNEWNNSLTSKKINEYKSKIKQLDKDLDKCFELFYNANNEEIRNRMNEKADSLTIQKKDLQGELRKIEMGRAVKHTKQEIIALLDIYLNGNINSADFQRKIINNFVNSVYFFDDKVAIYYNVFTNQPLAYDVAMESIAESEGVRILDDAVHHKASRLGCFFSCRGLEPEGSPPVGARPKTCSFLPALC